MASIKQVIVMRRDLKMRRGKEIAQGAHASLQFALRAIAARFDTPNALGQPDVRFSDAEEEWLGGSYRKVCVRANSEVELRSIHEAALAAGLRSFLIEDLGLTEFGGVLTPTCVAIGPDYDSKIDPITGHLGLL